MTNAELQTIVSSVISSLQTNSRTISGLTPVATLSDTDLFEVSGGRSVSYGVLKNLISSMSADDQDSLKTLINKNELKSVDITTTESSATLTISSIGKTIVTSVPIATTNKAGLMTATDKVKLQGAYDTANLANQTAKAANSTANSANNTATNAINLAGTAIAQSNDALIQSEDSQARVTELEEMVGSPNGIAVLDENSKIPAANLPSYVDDVVEFNAVVSGITLQMATSDKKSTDTGCMVMYNTDTNRLVLAVSKQQVPENLNWDAVLRPAKQNINTPSIQSDNDTPIVNPNNSLELDPSLSGYWEINDESLAIKTSAFTYYGSWSDADSFGSVTTEGRKPVSGKIYTCTSENKAFRWSGSNLTIIGSNLSLGKTAMTAFPGDEGAILQEDVAQLKESQAAALISQKLNGILPFDGFYEDVPGSNTGVWFRRLPEDEGGACIMWAEKYPEGYTAGDYNIIILGQIVSIRYDRIFRVLNELYRFDGNNLVKVGGAEIGNNFNATVKLPLPTGEYYYDIKTPNPPENGHNVLEAVYDTGKAVIGMQITYAIKAGSWKTFQYVGVNVEHNNFTAPANWLDLAAMSAGSEPFVNVNTLCGEGSLAGGCYTLESAIQAIIAKETETGITYRKAGMVITYKVANGKWDCKQLVTNVNDFNKPAAWADYGGGGDVEITASDTPVKNGKDPLSTGGAYASIPRHHEVTQEDGTVSIQFYADEAHDEPIMDPIEFLASQGGGGDSSGTIVSLAFRNSPLYAAFGQKMATKAAIRSVTTQGSVESENSIEKLELIDSETKAVVWQSTVNKPSSVSLTDYTFDIDFTSFFSVAGQKRFTLVATDDTSKTGRKSITVIAEDLTLTNMQKLFGTISPADTVASVDMLAFENNQSASGIRAKVEILIGNTWHEIMNTVVTNSFTQTAEINAVELGLTHGAYKLRMQGESVDSGVKGNIVYSTLMVVDPENTTPVLAIRYDDHNDGTIRLFDTVSVDLAAWRPGGDIAGCNVDLYIGTAKIANTNIKNNTVQTIKKQISGYEQGAELVIEASFGTPKTPQITLTVDGSALPISLKSGAVLHYDFGSRSNTESDHTITDHGITMQVNGANWRTNGFVNYLGDMALRIAENVTAEIPFAPFGDPTIEATGAAVQFKIATNNIRDKDAKLMSCYNPDTGAGFYVCGNRAGIFMKQGYNGSEGERKNISELKFSCGEQVTIAVVIEKSSIFDQRGTTKYSKMKLYVDGEKAGTIGYIPETGSVLNNTKISFNGEDGDLYLYYLLAYKSSYDWEQAFDNYLVKGTDTEAMVEEYNAEDVLISQSAEGSTAKRPSAAKLWSRGIRYMVNIAPSTTWETFDYGDGGSDNGLDTKPKFKGISQVFFDPVWPWRCYKATNVTKKRQGTTSTLRPIKNEDDDYSKATFTPLYPGYAPQELLDELWPAAAYTSDPELRSNLTAEQLVDVENTFKLFKLGYIRIGWNTMPIRKAMNKVDFSDSSCANNGGVCDMMNATYRAMGTDYLTPAQRFYNGTFDKGNVHLTGIELNHSIANFPCAIFRSYEETMQNVFFHARGSYMESKKEQLALGFRDVPGYNKGCLNYGDFKELFCAPGQTLAQFVAAADKSTWEYPVDMEDPDGEKYNVVVISEYSGSSFKVFRRTMPGAEWVETTGSMKQVGGQWIVSGDVLNPVTGFELLSYSGLCWFQGVSSVEDMMYMQPAMSSWVRKLGLSATQYPAWTQYFECMIEDDQLAIDYAMGRKVPVWLFRFMQFMDSVDYSKESLASTWANRFLTEAWKYMSVQSSMVYHIFTDYLAAVDQRAKNMQPMWFLEDGCKIEDGVFYGANGMEANRMYLNKVYDCDTCNGKDNESDETIDAEVDPDKASVPDPDNPGSYIYTNPYMGWGSILFNDIARTKNELVRTGAFDGEKYPTISLLSVANNMRTREITLTDGRKLAPFSAAGARYYFMEKRIMKWPKKVVSYDCERKYISRTSTANKVYYYADKGSGRKSLPLFINTRWLVRDGFYQTGSFLADSLVMRINAPANAQIRFKAAARGWFAVGNENVGQITEAVFLEAGESYAFTNFIKIDGTQLYLYQVGRMAELDFSDLDVNFGDGIRACKLLEKLILGKAGKVNGSWSYASQSSLKLDLPFLTDIDVTDTLISSINAGGSPRLEHVKADGSLLSTLTISETSPINDIILPGTMTELRLVGLPELTYTGIPELDGLKISAYATVQRLLVNDSPKVNATVLLKNITKAVNSALQGVRIEGQALRGDGQELLSILANNVQGLGSDGSIGAQPHPVILGTYNLTKLLTSQEVSQIESGIQGIEIEIVVEAYVNAIDEVNGEYYSGESEVETVTLENIGTHILYYNGETASEYVARIAAENISIHEIINQTA